jgi:Fic family protein
LKISTALTEAKAAVLSLKTIPYQRRWVETLQQMELKREVAGTSRIEGADFTDRELDAALKETPEQLRTRSQKQARAAVQTYRWIAGLSQDLPIDSNLICAIHRRIVKGADDDHCEPAELRGRDHNVTFGAPAHRGANGGDEVSLAFDQLTKAIQREYRDHDSLIQALAAHYHVAAMHPFLDGNGRTARAVEALLLQRAGLRDSSFIAMSNYYYDEKPAYLRALADTRQADHDLTPFLVFALKGIALQCQRLLTEIQHEISKELFRNLMFDLFNRLRSPRQRVIAERQIKILKILLGRDSIEWLELQDLLGPLYGTLKNSVKAMIRDMNNLLELGAIKLERYEKRKFRFSVRLEWPAEITETAFFEKIRNLPKAKSHSFLQIDSALRVS